LKKFFLTVFVLGILAAGALVFKNRYYDRLNEPVEIPPAPTAKPIPSPTVVIVIKRLPITLPLLDALFFVDKQFADELKKRLELTDDQIAQLRLAAREETSSLDETESSETTTEAGEKAASRIAAIIGGEKSEPFADFVLERWRTMGSSDSDTVSISEEPAALGTPSPIELPPDPRTSPSPSPSAAAGSAAKPVLTPSAPFSAPTDTRIVVNAPSRRMDVFQNGQLIKSYIVGISYPEFPLPTGMRKATQIIFNPTWTPPDEPWVESSKKVKVGQKIAAGDRLNPLGVIKIPIGLPSLIHGGKAPAKIGEFASHGCVGLTDKQVQSFAQVLAELGGIELLEDQIAQYEKNRKETKVVKLKATIPVELRYETLAVEGGKLHIYRDVYDRGTNVKENLESLLATYGLTLTDLSNGETKQAMDALAVMSQGPDGKAGGQLTEAQKAEQRRQNIARQQLTRQYKGRKEVVVEIAALTGKGYPEPVDLETGNPPKPAAATAKSRRKKAD